MFAKGTLLQPPPAEREYFRVEAIEVNAESGFRALSSLRRLPVNLTASKAAKQDVYNRGVPFMTGAAQQGIGWEVLGEAAACGDAGVTADWSAR